MPYLRFTPTNETPDVPARFQVEVFHDLTNEYPRPLLTLNLSTHFEPHTTQVQTSPDLQEPLVLMAEGDETNGVKDALKLTLENLRVSLETLEQDLDRFSDRDLQALLEAMTGVRRPPGQYRGPQGRLERITERYIEHTSDPDSEPVAVTVAGQDRALSIGDGAVRYDFTAQGGERLTFTRED